MKFRYEEQPYGYVDLIDCIVEERNVPDYCKPVRVNYVTSYPVERKAKFIVGYVEKSSYCGALLCGVPLVKSTEKYPVGSKFEVEVNDNDIARCYKIRIAM